MKKFFILGTLIVVSIIMSGCTSNIVAKFDDYNEIFTGKSYYDPTCGRAIIDVKSNQTGAICLGNAHFYVPYIWSFELTCSDGRAITGKLISGRKEDKAFTNRNETITFTVAKKQSTINDATKNYKNSIDGKPLADDTKEHINVILGR